MSFILDALKKSESDRQRQSGPALFEVKVAPPRSGLPAWALAIAALLLVNLGVVGWVLLRHPSAHATTVAAAPAPAPQPLSATPPPPAPPPAPPAQAPLSAAAAPAAAPAAAAAAPASAVPSSAAPPAGAADEGNPQDYAPATDPPPPGPQDGHVRRGTVAGVPLYQDAAATPGVDLPQLRLDLHVYAAHPQDRFVMINMHKLHEGDSLPEGVRVESITPEGAVMSYHGSRFMLPRD
jgi:general secretion pathway protein B